MSSAWRRAFREANRGREEEAAAEYFDTAIVNLAEWQALVADPRVTPAMLADLRRQTVEQLADLLSARWEHA